MSSPDVLRFGIRSQPPCLGVEFRERSYIKCCEIPIDISSGESSVIVHKLINAYSALFEAVDHDQLEQLIAQLLVSTEAIDLNRVSDSTLTAAKRAMENKFEQNLIKPGDARYQHEINVEFDDPTEPSDWD